MYFEAKQDEARILRELHAIEELKAACQRAEFAIWSDVLERETMLRARLEGARSTVFDQPTRVTEQRLSEAPPDERRLLERMGPAKLPPGSVLNSLVLSGLIRDRRRAGLVACSSPRHSGGVCGPGSITAGTGTRETQRLGYEDVRHPAEDDARQIRRQVSATLNKLTARVVRAYYPTWGESVTPSFTKRATARASEGSEPRGFPAAICRREDATWGQAASSLAFADASSFC